MNTRPEDIDNRNGSKHMLRGGRTIRASRTTVSIKGVEIDVEYEAIGAFLAATDIDDACAPTARVLSAEIGGVPCLQLLNVEELEAAVERGWL